MKPQYNEGDIYLAAPSAFPVRLEMRFNGTPLGVGTGYLNTAGTNPLLITARHNLTGCHQVTGECLSKATGGIPNEVLIRHHADDFLTYVDQVEPLLSDEVPLWHEHPTLGASADFVALPLTQLTGVNLNHSVFPFMRPTMRLSPSDSVSVIGFPFGVSGAGDLAIWTTGFIATEIELDYGGLPQFLIDARTRPGQSGSPVIAYRTDFVRGRNGALGQLDMPNWDLLGIYSGRINADSDIGVVWKLSAIIELIRSLAISQPPDATG